MKAWLFLTAALLLNSFANILMKVGAATQKTLAEDASFFSKAVNFLNIATLAGIILFAGNVLLYRKALDGLPISIAYPVMVSLGLIIVVVFARFLPILSERISLLQIVGMVLIVAGVWLVSQCPAK